MNLIQDLIKNKGVIMKSKYIKIVFLISILLMINNQFSRAQMFWNQACSFGGATNKYIAVPNSSSLNITGNFSVEAWINPSVVSPTAKTIISKGGSMKYAIQFQDGRIKFYTNGILRLATRAGLPMKTNQWTHIA